MLLKFAIFIFVIPNIKVLNALINPVNPTHYDLWLEVDDESKIVRGTVDIKLEISDIRNNIVLNYKELDIDVQTAELRLISPEKEEGDVIPIETIHFIPLTESFVIQTQEQIGSGQYSLHLEWATKIRLSGKEGLFQVNYEIRGSVVNYRRVAILTNFRATHARSVFPCFDEPRYKATIGFTLKYRRFFNALSVTKWEIPDTEGEWAIRKFKTTPPIQTSFFGFVIYHSERDGGLPQMTIDNRVYIHASSSLFNQSLAILPFVNRTLSAYQSYFGSQYELDEFNVLAVPFPMDFVIENWGLVVADQDLVIQVPLISPPQQFQRSLQFFSSQFGLNWLEGEVSVEDWRYIWLTRGLNKLLEYWIPAQNPLLNEVISWNQFSYGVTQAAFTIDENPDVQPMEREVTSPEEINARFDDVISVKSAAVLNTIRNAVSKEAFDDALKHLLTNKKGGLISSKDFFDEFSVEVTEALPASLEEIFDSWTKQTGYPVLQVTRPNNNLVVGFKRQSNKKFHVPINYAESTNLNFSNTLPDFWLESPDGTSSLDTLTENEFLIFNKQQSGYYRVHYDPRSLELISAHLKSKHETVHPVNRAQLIEDLTYFALNGQQEYGTLFELLNFIDVEDNYLPWLVINRRLNEIYQRLRGSETYGRFETFLREKTEEQFNQWGLSGITVRHRTRLMKEAVADLACNAGNARCVNETLALVEKMLKNEAPGELIYPESIPIVACTAFKYDFNLLGRIMDMIRLPSTAATLQTSQSSATDDENDERNTKINPLTYEDDLEFIARMFGVSPSMLEQISRSIGCSQNQNSLQAILDLTIIPNKQLRFGREMRRRLYSVIVRGSYLGAKLGLRFMATNFLGMNQRYDDMGLVFAAFKDLIYTDELSELFNEVYARHAFRFYPEHVKVAADEVMSQIDTNLEWAYEYVPQIEAWLEANNFEPTEKPTAPEEPEEGGSMMYVLIIAGSVLLIAVVTVVVVFFVVRSRNRRSNPRFPQFASTS